MKKIKLHIGLFAEVTDILIIIDSSNGSATRFQQ